MHRGRSARSARVARGDRCCGCVPRAEGGAAAEAEEREDDPIARAPEEEVSVGPLDVLSLMTTNMMQATTGAASADGAPVAQGSLSDLQGGPLFLSLFRFYQRTGSVYKLIFGPKSFLVLSGPSEAKTILRSRAFSLDKGVLSEILYPIMGKVPTLHHLPLCCAASSPLTLISASAAIRVSFPLISRPGRAADVPSFPVFMSAGSHT